MAVRQKAVATLMRALRKETSKPHNQQRLPSLRRAFSLYDQVNLIDNVPEDQLRFQGYTDEGFTVNGVSYEGGVLCVGNLITSWSPKKFSDITVDSLSMFQIVRPIPEIFILGCGRNIQLVNPELRRFIRSTGMKLEALDSEKLGAIKLRFPVWVRGQFTLDGIMTNDALKVGKDDFLYVGSSSLDRNASSTYNILNEEGRIVAAALLPYGVTS